MSEFYKPQITAPITMFTQGLSGNISMRFALVITVISIAIALMVPPAIERNSRVLSYDGQLVDTMVTGSIRNTKRYHIRRSILDNN